jgi:hypothetical protein
LHVYDDICLVGFHSEEAVYGPRYYYPGGRLANDYHRQIETEFPRDTLLCALSARPEVIQERRRTAPHDYPLVPEADVEEVLAAFDREFAASWLKRKFRLDTSDLAPEDVLPAFLRAAKRHLRERDLLLLQAYGAMP